MSLIDQIKEHEGFRSRVYQCTEGHDTIGFGFKVVYNMCYQMGVSGFSKFKKTIQYLMDEDYDNASREMLDSRWSRQTPNRSIELSNIVKAQSNE
jgi:lysozyme